MAVQIELERFDVLKVQSIDTVSQSFYARCFVQLRLIGAKARRESFVTFEDGAKSAEWFAKQIEPYNSFEHDSFKVDSPKIKAKGNDLLIEVRMEGRFAQPMDLHDFPFDSQGLSMDFLIKCRVDGPVPSVVKVSPRVSCSLVNIGFAPRFQWRREGEVSCHPGTHEANGRTFPKFGAKVMVARKSRFYVTNIAIPTAVFSGLAFTLFAAPPSDAMARLSVVLTLLLAMAAYKITVAGMIPLVSYETLLDKFLLGNFFLVAFLAIASALLPLAKGEVEDLANLVCFALLGTVWCLIQAWFVKAWFAPVQQPGGRASSLAVIV